MSRIKMFKISIFSFITIVGLLFTSCDEKTTDFRVKGKLKNVSNSYFYAARELKDTLVVDTIAIDSKGRFSFSGKVDTLTIVSLYFNDNRKYAYLFVDKGLSVEVEGDVLYSDLFQVKGGEINNDLTAFKKQNGDLLKKRIEILDAVARDNAEDAREKHSVEKDYVVELKNINFELSNIAASYVRANPDKIASVMLINTFFKDELAITRLDESLSFLRGKAVTFPVAQDLAAFSKQIKQSTVGGLRPDFALKDLKGKMTNISQFSGKYVLLSFVSTTCDMCDAQLEESLPMYDEFKKNKTNIEFVTVVIDTEKKPLTNDIRDKVRWVVLPGDGGWSSHVLNSYNIHELPYNILISPTGVILSRDFPIHALPSKMKELQ